MMTPTSRGPTGGAWMVGGSSDIRLSASIPGLEDDPRWRPTTSCPSPTSNDQSLMKDGHPSTSSFSKGLLDEEEWYIAAPDNSLMDDMKELSSYASTLASNSHTDNNNVSAAAAHFNLDSANLQSFLSRNVSNGRPSPFNTLDHSRSNLSFLDGGLPFEGSGSLMSNFRQRLGGNVILDAQNGGGNGSNGLVGAGGGSGGILMGLGQNVLSNNNNNALGSSSRSPGGMLRNLSPRRSLGDGGFNHGSLGGNLSSILTNGINNNNNNSSSFTNTTPAAGGNNSSSSPFMVNNGGFNNSLSRTLLGKDNNSNSLLLNVERPPFRSKNLLSNPLEVAPPSSTSSLHHHHHHHQQQQQQQQQEQQQQTLFQKRAALRHSVSGGAISPTMKCSPPQVVTSASNDSSVDMPDEESPNINKGNINNNSIKGVLPSPNSSLLDDKNRRRPAQTSGSDEVGEFAGGGLAEQRSVLPDHHDEGKEEDDMDESGDGSGVLYETDDTLGMEGPGGAGGGAGGQGGMVHGMSGEKGKGKKGLPAKNLMAERRRRKKLNDRLYMLRSVVPKITKMDRASILGDAIEYLKELLQRINDLHTELEATPVDRPLPPSSPALPPIPPPTTTMPTLACRVKEESPSSLPSPDAQPARVEVRTREGRALNIHMFCERRPGLLLSTMRALDGLGLDVQQAVISCFNGFALDVFKAEQSKEADVCPDEIRAVLLHAAGSNFGTL